MNLVLLIHNSFSYVIDKVLEEFLIHIQIAFASNGKIQPMDDKPESTPNLCNFELDALRIIIHIVVRSSNLEHYSLNRLNTQQNTMLELGEMQALTY